jgi:hypothetical protein
MALKKIVLKPGINRENTRYTTEWGWYDCDNVRFRQGTPEKLGGWERISTTSFLGVCRSLSNWVTLGSLNLIGAGTNLKFYIESGGAYIDVTPLRSAVTLTNPFSTTSGSAIIEVDDSNGGYIDGDFVSYYGASAIGGITLSGMYEISTDNSTGYTINTTVPVSITIDSPAVFTSQNKLANDVAVTLATTGVLPAPLVSGTTYYVVNTSGYTLLPLLMLRPQPVGVRFVPCMKSTSALLLLRRLLGGGLVRGVLVRGVLAKRQRIPSGCGRNRTSAKI